MIETVVFLGAKYLIAHSVHALAAKGALAAHHPVSTATTMVGHHVATSVISNATVPAVTNIAYAPVLNQGATAAVLSHGATGVIGTAAAPSASDSVLRDTAMVAVPVIARAVWQQVRRSQAVRGT